MDASDPKVIKPLVAWECREPDRNGGRTTCAHRKFHSAVFTNVTLLHCAQNLPQYQFARDKMIRCPHDKHVFLLVFSRGGKVILLCEPRSPRSDIFFRSPCSWSKVCSRSTDAGLSSVLSRGSRSGFAIGSAARFARVVAGNQQHKVPEVLVIVRCESHRRRLRQNLPAIVDIECVR